jgi:hypothetical protein
MHAKRGRVRLAGLAAVVAGLAMSGAAQAVSCQSGAKAAADLWKEYDKIAKQVGCAAGTGAAAIASAGTTLPQSVQIYRQCLEKANEADKTTRKMIAKWNELNKNGWGTIGPRRLALDTQHSGTIRGAFTRMFITESPLRQDRLTVNLTKQRFRGKTDVVVCSYLPDSNDGTQIDHYTIAKGLDNKGQAWIKEYSGLQGRIVSVFINGRSAAKSMKYTLWADTSAAPDADSSAQSEASNSRADAPSDDTNSVPGGSRDVAEGVGTINTDQANQTGSNSSGEKGRLQQAPAVNPNLDAGITPVEAQASAKGQQGAAGMAGRWDTQHGELRLRQLGDLIVGDYADRGVLIGRINGDCLAGVFTNGPRNGVFRFTVKGGDRFKGQWAWHGQTPNNPWSGKRTGPAPDTFRNFTRDGSTITSRANTRDVFDGIYKTNHGRVALWARHLFVVGDYAKKGLLLGMWDGDSFVGRFTNDDRTGWFDLTFLSKTGDFRRGRWGWLDSDRGGAWKLNEVSDFAYPAEVSFPGVSCP